MFNNRYIRFAFQALIIALVFFTNSSVYPSVSDYLQNSEGILKVYGISYIEKNSKIDTMIKTGYGFFINNEVNGVLIVTSFNNVKGCEEVFVEYQGNNNKSSQKKTLIKVYPYESTQKYYWFDDSRDIVVFKIPDINPEFSLPVVYDHIELDKELFFPSYDEIKLNGSSTVTYLIKDTFVRWIVASTSIDVVNICGMPVLNREGGVIGMVSIVQLNSENTLIWIVPSKFIGFIVDEIKLNSVPTFGKQIDDFLLTPDDYARMENYNSNNYYKLFN